MSQNRDIPSIDNSESEADMFSDIVKKATGEVIGKSLLNSVDDVREIVRLSRSAQKEWVKISVKERARIIKKTGQYICNNCDLLASKISDDNGKTRIDALITELIPAAMSVSYYAKKAKKFLKDKFIVPGNLLLANKISKKRRVPFGTIGIISPWNYPFVIPFSEIVMSLLAGNAVILKTASETQLVGQALKEVFESIGLPENLFNYVNLPGRIAGDAFLDSGVDKLFFTGSVPVGKYLMKKAAETLTPVSLELGGNDAMLVCEDADLYRAASGAVWAGFQNAGQSCGGVERIYVHSSVYDDFMAILKEKTESLRVGYDMDFNLDIGVMTTEKQVKSVETHINDAIEKGAAIYARAGSGEGSKWKNLVNPLVLTDVNHDMLVMKEETFGPVIGVMKVDNMDEAIELANDSNLGLTGSVWTRSNKYGFELGKRIRAGAVTINDHLMSHGLAETPWGGFKESGIGRTHGEIGFDEMTEPQVIVMDIMPFVKRNLWWHPHNEKVYNGLKGIIEVLHGKNFGVKIKGFIKVIFIYGRTFLK
ncbi:MAG: benzaldehyde dehydrogenase [Deltaproteobacteria bacterium]|nr:MAG: benzaldehyde dehydrogenase [Deltaproteobacteria bacterium]